MVKIEEPTHAERTVHADNDLLAAQITNYREVLADASRNDEAEHQMSVKEAFRIHKKAIFWSMALSTALVMEGYDVVSVASFYGLPQFTERFGVLGPDGVTYLIPAVWQTALGNGSSAGCIIGLLFNGWASERFGPRRTYVVGMLCVMAAIFGYVFAQSLPALVASAVCNGFVLGIFQALASTYASDVAPIKLRHYVSSYINACWGIGILLSSGTVRGTLTIPGDLAWRLPFCLQWVWPIPLAIVGYFAPESPYWLVRQGRYADAERSVARLTADSFTEEETKAAVANIIVTTELERQAQEGTSYLQCFKGVDARRTEIVCMTFAIQLLSGQNLIGQGVQFFVVAGLSTVAAYDVNLALNSMFIIGTIASWLVLGRIGRRTLYLSGVAAMGSTLLVIGGLGFSNASAAKWISGGLLVLLNFIYNVSLGAGCYVIISEMSSTRLRAKSIVLARSSYQIVNIIVGILVPRMLSPEAWNWGAKSGLFWAGSCVLCFIWCWFRLPESGGRSYGELEVLFNNRVPAWKFSKTKVDQFGLSGDAVPSHISQVEKDGLKGHEEQIEHSPAAVRY